ncbi:hypothetical protein LP419_14550 [Massilia sp. H-1]|nr:hypothetical protein LP419_14550 [Massilia sp. H-1]
MRSAQAPVYLASQIAGRGKALALRIGALLDQRRARAPVSRGQWLLGAAASLALVLVLGTLVQRGEHVVWPDALLAPAWVRRAQAPKRCSRRSTIRISGSWQAPCALADFTQRHAAGDASFRQRAAIPALVLALQDQRPPVRRLAAWGLSEMRFPETAPAAGRAAGRSGVKQCGPKRQARSATWARRAGCPPWRPCCATPSRACAHVWPTCWAISRSRRARRRCSPCWATPTRVASEARWALAELR